MINIITTSRYKVNRKAITSQVGSLLTQYGVPTDAEVNIVFIGKRKMREIASTYKNEDVALPVLCFSYKDDMTESNRLFGEIFICYPQAVLLAAERNKKVEVMFASLLEHAVNNLLK